MNKGLIGGIVRNPDGSDATAALVSFSSLLVGHRNLTVYHPKHEDQTTIPLQPTNKQGQFRIPFQWPETDVGDYLGLVKFRVFAVDRTRNMKGAAIEKFYVAPDIQALTDELADEIMPDILEFFPLASAISTMLTPRLSNRQMVGFGGAIIWLE